MKVDRVTSAGMPWPRWKLLTAVSIPAAAILTMKLVILLWGGWIAIQYRYGIDYGEGIVWQQMRSIAAGDAYGPIDGFPAIVFHYPPLYHLATWSIAALGGLDQLVAGRSLSLLATIAAAGLIGWMTAQLVPAGVPRHLRVMGASAAALMALTMEPIQLWAPLMRVDMLAFALALGGVCLALRALDRPRLIHLAAAAFVAALYTKQSMIAAPAAVFLVLLITRPRLAVSGIATSLVLGLVPLVILTAVTDGGFVRHIFLYNINRFDPARLWIMWGHGSRHALYFILALLGLLVAARTWRGQPGRRPALAALASDNAAVRLLIITAYFVFATGMALMIAKSGSGPNYLLEWITAACVLAGVGMADVIHRLRSKSNLVFVAVTFAISFEIALQALLLPNAGFMRQALALGQEKLKPVESLIRAADGPVISDEMVLLLRSDREVLWESAIFAELSETGQYDIGPMIAKIERGEFALIMTRGRRGSEPFDSRYPLAVADAIDAAYPVKRKVRAFVLHLRPEQAMANANPAG